MSHDVQYFLDENIPAGVKEGLRRRGIDVLTALDEGLGGATDRKLLAFAVSNDRVLVTRDADFLRMHQAEVPHAGIVYCRQHTLSIGELLRGLVLIHAVLDRETMRQHVEFL